MRTQPPNFQDKTFCAKLFKKSPKMAKKSWGRAPEPPPFSNPGSSPVMYMAGPGPGCAGYLILGGILLLRGEPHPERLTWLFPQ